MATKRADNKKQAASSLRRELDIHREELAAQNEELRAANVELEAAKERYARLYEEAPIGYFTIDAHGMLAEASVAGADMLGVRRAELVGRSFFDFLKPSMRDRFRAGLRSVVGGARRSTLDTVVTGATRTIPAHVEVALVTPDGTGPAEILLCVTDDTARERLEDERRALDARTAEAHRLESLGRMAGGIAHDFNNILAVVLSCSDLALRDLERDSPARSAIIEVREAAERAAELSKQMLAYSGSARLQRRDVDLSEIVASMESLLRASVSKDLVLELDLESQLPVVEGDPVQLRQIVLNLVLNASDALAGRRGTVVVRTRAPRKGVVTLEVSDDGPGMDEATMRRVFDPFFSTKLSGRGLGLAVVHGNARAHGGSVSVMSELGRGAVFTVTFPAREVARPARAAGRGCILVVDDEPQLRATAARVLHMLGYTTHQAASGFAGVEAVRREGEGYAGVLLDLTMPGMDGRATLAELRRLKPDLPVILTSGYGVAPEDAELGPTTAFLAKPYDVVSLERAMDLLIPRKAHS